MTRIRTYRRPQPVLALILALSLLTSACDSNDLSTVSKALKDTASAVSILQTTVIDANAAGTISDANTRELLEIAVRVNQAGLFATAITRNLTTLDSTSKSDLLTILRPITTTITYALTDEWAGIRSDETRARIGAALSLINASLNSAQIILASSN